MKGNITLESALIELKIYSDDVIIDPVKLKDEDVIVDVSNYTIFLNKKTTFTTLNAFLMSIWTRHLAYSFPMNKEKFVRNWRVTNEENLIYPLNYFKAYLRERNLMKIEE